MTYQNLKDELLANGITTQMCADVLDTTANSVWLMIRELAPFPVANLKTLRDTYFADKTLDYLAQSDGDIPSKTECLRAQTAELAEILRAEAAPENEQELEELITKLNDEIDEWDLQYGDGE